jgi:hypothetical protein
MESPNSSQRKEYLNSSKAKKDEYLLLGMGSECHWAIQKTRMITVMKASY